MKTSIVTRYNNDWKSRKVYEENKKKEKLTFKTKKK